MKRLTMLCAVLSVAGLFLITAGPNDKTMTGTYKWTYNKSDEPIRAVFSPSGATDKWNVTFYFTFDGRDRVYVGTAQGKLSSGSLSGEVKNENKQRTFTFTGTSSDGTFNGTHAEIKRGSSRPMGTIELTLQ